MDTRQYSQDTVLEVGDRMQSLALTIYGADAADKITGEMCRDWAAQLRSWANMLNGMPIIDSGATIYLDVNGI